MEQKSIALIIVALVVGVAAGAGIGMVAFGDDQNDDETYHYFLYFGEADENNGWYSATGSDAAVAFDKAMKKAGFEYEISSWGYVSTINGNSMDYSAQYLYKSTDSAAAEGSIQYPDATNTHSNGWFNILGYDEDGVNNKIIQMDSTIFFISYYDSSFIAIYPWTAAAYAEWSVSGPFAA